MHLWPHSSALEVRQWLPWCFHQVCLRTFSAISPLYLFFPFPLPLLFTLAACSCGYSSSHLFTWASSTHWLQESSPLISPTHPSPPAPPSLAMQSGLLFSHILWLQYHQRFCWNWRDVGLGGWGAGVQSGVRMSDVSSMTHPSSLLSVINSVLKTLRLVLWPFLLPSPAAMRIEHPSRSLSSPSSLEFPPFLPIKSLPSLPYSSHLGPCQFFLGPSVLCSLHYLRGWFHGHPSYHPLTTHWVLTSMSVALISPTTPSRFAGPFSDRLLVHISLNQFYPLLVFWHPLFS